MGQYGSAQVVYGWHLDEDDLEKIESEPDDWAEENELDFDIGGNHSYDWSEYIVGVKIGPWISDLGVHEIDDDFAVVPPGLYDRLKPHVEFFGREPKKHLVLSYG